MFFGQTSNWRKIRSEVTDRNKNSVPGIAAQYNDGTNAVRVHCGSESLVLLKVQLYLTNEEDAEIFDKFLHHFGLPQNGYQVVQAPLTYQPATYPVYNGAGEVPNAPIQLVGPSNP